MSYFVEPSLHTVVFRKDVIWQDLAEDVSGQHTRVKLQVHISMKKKTPHLKVGFGKESNQFFDFISPALVYEFLYQLEAEEMRKGETYFMIVH